MNYLKLFDDLVSGKVDMDSPESVGHLEEMRTLLAGSVDLMKDGCGEACGRLTNYIWLDGPRHHDLVLHRAAGFPCARCLQGGVC